MRLQKPVFLIGFMGAGKSSVARRCARSAGIGSLDIDTYIERSCGKKIPAIFEEDGEETFRKMEAQTLEELASRDNPLLYSCGGGIVVTPENVKVMRDAGVVIYLEVEAEEAAARISDPSTRPLMTDLAAARERLESRLPMYEQAAHFKIDTSGKHVGAISSELIDLLKREGVLCPQ